MTIGIYKLIFKGTDKIYIGQSSRIEVRFMEHLNKLHKKEHSRKLQEAYAIYGEPTIEFIHICHKDELDDLENYYITKYNSYYQGFNSTEDARGPKLQGLDSPHSKLDKLTYISILKDLVNTTLLIKEIASKYSTTVDTVTHISLGRTHSWLSKECPDEYIRLLALVGSRQKKIKGLITLKDPEGDLVEVDCSIREFAKRHSMAAPGHISNLINGKRKSYLKWTLFSIKEA